MRRGTRRVLPSLLGLFVTLIGFPLGSPPPVAAVSPDLVVSQVYGGGGNTGAPFTHDYIELFNRGQSPASLSGLSLQYASSTGTGNFGANSGQITDLPSVTVAPGQYVLVQEASGANGAALPTPDVTDPTPINMSGTAGKVALVSGTTSLGCNGGSTPCSAAQLARIVDLVGYGSANFYEGSAAAPTLSNTTAAFRNGGGCADTDDNANDFSAAAPGPRNTASPAAPCAVAPSLSVNDVSGGEGNTGVASFDFTVSLSAPAPSGGVTFDIATADGTASSTHDYVARSLVGQTIPAGSSAYTFSVSVNGDEVTEDDETFTVNITNISGAQAGDTQGVGTIVNDDSCGLPFKPIYEIQGSGMQAAYTGNVTTQGVVVGDFEGPTSTGLQGFYLQDVAGDGSAATSDGIFVYTGNSDNGLSAGDVVRVTGFARERFDQTAINGSNSNSAAVTQIVSCGTASVLPTDVSLPVETTTDFEKYEGMLVRFPQSLVIAEYFNYERFGELVLARPLDGESRPFTPTLLEEPGSDEYRARLSANWRSRITLDDGTGASYPNVVRHPNGQPFSLSNRFRGGDTVQNTVGVLGFDFSLYRIQPTAGADYTATNTRPASPADVGGRIQVASMNTLNYFLTLDTTTSDSGPGPCGGNRNLDCRGADADQTQEFDRQRAKLLAALNGLGAEVIGLNELENTPGVEPLADIVAGLNAMPGNGPGTWAFVDTGVIGTDAIKVGLIYKPGAVTPLGAHQILDSSDDPRFIDTLSRPVLAQTFRENSTGAVFTVAVNHLKSKNSNPACVPDSGDGQGSCSEVREAAAQALVDWLATDPTSSGDPDFLIVGDLNAYAMEDPIDAVRAGSDGHLGTGDDYTNLIAQYGGRYAYSYVFDGMAGYLDHALATTSLTTQVTGATEWHINADEPDILDYDTSSKPPAQEAIYEPNAFRSSDHDPVLVGLNLATAVGKVTGNGTWADGAFDISVLFAAGRSDPQGYVSLGVPAGTFASSGVEWLVVAGNRATLQAQGTFNGAPGYGLLFSAMDNGSPGRQDRVRVRVWAPDGSTVYDSQPGAPVTAAPTARLTGGNLVVQLK